MRQYLRVAFILAGALVLIFLLNEYNKRLETEVITENVEGFLQDVPAQNGTSPPAQEQALAAAPTQEQAQAQAQAQVQEQPAAQAALPGPSEAGGLNETNAALPGATANVVPSRALPQDCFPKDQLTPAELLPADANSKWAQVNPAGQGEVGTQNFLDAGYHVGVNTVGQSLRNANRQIRSEPANPQVKVSPWNQTTIEPDVNRRPLEIGSD